LHPPRKLARTLAGSGDGPAGVELRHVEVATAPNAAGRLTVRLGGGEPVPAYNVSGAALAAGQGAWALRGGGVVLVLGRVAQAAP
jgi:hypothetical protein